MLASISTVLGWYVFLTLPVGVIACFFYGVCRTSFDSKPYLSGVVSAASFFVGFYGSLHAFETVNSYFRAHQGELKIEYDMPVVDKRTLHSQ